MKAICYSKNTISSKSNREKKREATDGKVLNRWLQGVKMKFLAPFFMVLMGIEPIKTMREAPFGSYYPMVTNWILKCNKSHRFTQKKVPCNNFKINILKIDGIIFTC